MNRRVRRPIPIPLEPLEPRRLLASGAGLTAHYFDDPNLTDLKLTRRDSTVNFNWAASSPDPTLAPNTFSARWTGTLQPAHSETYSLYLTADDGVRLWINGQLLINRWSDQPAATESSATIPLIQGRKYDLTLEHYEDIGNASVKLEWSSPTQSRQIIPTERLYPSERGTLLREIYPNIPGASIADLTTHPSYPDFPAAVSPLTEARSPSNAGDNFGTRVRGYLHAPQTGRYRFTLDADAAAQLFLSNSDDPTQKRLIASVDSPGATTSLDIRLVAGQTYYLEALHKEGIGTDHLRIGWTLPDGTTDSAIPGHHLSPPTPEVRLIADEHAASESSPNPALYTVLRTGGSLALPITVNYAMMGDAINGTDYQSLPGSITLPAGQRSATIRVIPVNDFVTEPRREEFRLTLAEGPGYTLASDANITATGTIQDDENIPNPFGQVLPPNSVSTSVWFNSGIPTYGTRTTVSVSDVPFAQAMQIATTNNPPQTYSIQIVGRTTAAVTLNDTLFASFYARAAGSSTTAKVEMVFERNGTPFDKSITFAATVGTEWTKIEIPFKAHDNFAAGAAQMNLRFGFNNQTIQVGGITLSNFGTAIAPGDLPKTTFAYQGRKSTDAWRDPADQRIDQNRKGNLTVTVRDIAGNPIEGALVNLRQVRHEFAFGSAVSADGINDTHATNGPNYRARLKELFNRVVLENDLKWPNWQGNRTKAVNAIAWLRNNPGLSGIAPEIRGHNLIWPNWRWMPSSTGQQSGTYNSPAGAIPWSGSNSGPYYPSQAEYDAHVTGDGVEGAKLWLQNRVRSHITEEASYPGVKGNLIDWDVINEPYSEHAVQDLLGNLEMVEWFKLAKAADPNAILYLNDYPPPTGAPGTSGHLDAFYNTIQYLLTNGAPLEGIGIQGHFGANGLGIDGVLTTYDRFSSYNLPIQITEFDIDTTDEQLQADFTRDFLTATFSHGALDGFMMWGFWQNRHWRPNAAMYRTDWSIKPNGQMFKDLVFADWWTEDRGTTTSDGRYTGRGFLGTYDVVVTVGNETKTVRANLNPGSNSLDVQLQSFIPTGTDGADTFTLRRAATAPNLLFWHNTATTNPPTASIPLASLGQVEIRGQGGADRLVLDYSTGVPFTGNNLIFDGSDGSDLLEILGTSQGDSATVLPNLTTFNNTNIHWSGVDEMRLDTNTGIDSLTIDAPLAFSPDFRSGAEADLLSINAGTYRFDGNTSNNNPDLSVIASNNASLRFDASTRLGALTLNDTARADLLPGGPKTLRLSSLTLGGDATLDLHDNDLILHIPPANRDAELLRLNTLIRNGRGGGTWNNPGLTSSSARDDLSGLTGLAIAPHEDGVLVRYTWKTDATADGRVDADDVWSIDRGFLARAGGLFHRGDFDFDLDVDLNDYATLDTLHLTPLPTWR